MLLVRTRGLGEETKDEKSKYLTALGQAENEYQVALSCFAEATDPEIIDEAAFLMQAARRKYSYFLKKVREFTA